MNMDVDVYEEEVIDRCQSILTRALLRDAEAESSVTWEHAYGVIQASWGSLLSTVLAALTSVSGMTLDESLGVGVTVMQAGDRIAWFRVEGDVDAASKSVLAWSTHRRLLMLDEALSVNGWVQPKVALPAHLHARAYNVNQEGFDEWGQPVPVKGDKWVKV